MPIVFAVTGQQSLHYPLKLDFNISKTDVNRSEQIVLTANYSINMSDKASRRNITSFDYNFARLNNNFKIIKVDGLNNTISSGKIEISGPLNISERKPKNWTLVAGINATVGSVLLFEPSTIKKTIDNGKIKKGNKHLTIYIEPNITYNNSYNRNIKLLIKNNLPEINKKLTKVIVHYPQINDVGPELIYSEIDKNLLADHIVSAKDLEDNYNLQYVWTIQNKSGPTDNKFETNLNISNRPWKLTSGENYNFTVQARDISGNYSESVTAEIFIDNKWTNRTDICVPPWEFYRTNLFLILIVAFIVSILSFFGSDFCIIRLGELPRVFQKKFNKYIDNYVDYPIINALGLILIISFVFYLLLTSDVYYDHIYLNSLAFYELYPFTIITVLFGYLAEEKYFKTDKSSSKYNIHLINIILTIFILASFYGISSSITYDIYEHLSRYYSNIVQICAILLGLILGFYTAKFNNSKIESREVYLNTLEYLVLLYGTIIILSLWGLSLGRSISFTPLIQFTQEELPNIVSIWVFESTLLLLPLAITSLYRIIKASNQ